MTDRYSSQSGRSVDWITMGVFIALVVIGWICIFATTCTHPYAGFDTKSKYCMQLLWIGVSSLAAGTVMVLPNRLFHIYAIPFYILSMLLLVATLAVGREIKGARSWIEIGGVSIQTAEFMKLAACLAVARIMSEYDFSITRVKDILSVAGLLLLPVAVIIMQNDTGSAVVYSSFLFMLYREGVPGWLYLLIASALLLFVLSFLIQPTALILGLLTVYIIYTAATNGIWKQAAILLAAILLCTGIIYTVMNTILPAGMTLFRSLLCSCVLCAVPTVFYASREQLKGIYFSLAFFFSSVIYTRLIDFVFNNVLQTHQQKRILDLLGLETDLKVWGYNVNQSKIAIGSGGFFGKGFMNGTQTNYGFVPEQGTDFIFCTIGEEFGFTGALVVICLFAWLIIRLINMGERQVSKFSRIFCYSVAGILLFHVTVNIGMTIGIIPVIGIPLPLFSYGGSSLLVFTLMVFTALRLDASDIAD